MGLLVLCAVQQIQRGPVLIVKMCGALLVRKQKGKTNADDFEFENTTPPLGSRP